MEPTASHSQSSFDSDLPISELSLTESTRSLDSEHPRIAQLISPNESQHSSEELPRVNIEPPPEFELGFSHGFGAKAVMINQSKLKQARKFFEETQLEVEPTASCFVPKGLPSPKSP